MSLRDEIQWAIDEYKKGKTEEDKRNTALRISAGWTKHFGKHVVDSLKRGVNEKLGLRIFDVGGKR